MKSFKYILLRKCDCGTWEFVKGVNRANYPCCAGHEKVVEV